MKIRDFVFIAMRGKTMCKFCEEIAMNDEECGKFIINGKEDFIFKDDCGEGFKILTDTGDSFVHGVIDNVRYCPRCGRKL